MALPRTLLAAALALLLPAAAQAAPPWSAPAAVPGTPDAFSGVAFAPSGNGFAGWSTGGFSPANRYEVSGFSLGPDGVAGPVRTVGGGLLAAFFAAYGDDALVAAGGTYGVRPRPLVAFGRVDGALGAPRRLAGTRRGYTSGLAANARGDLAIVLLLCPARGRECSRRTPYLVTGRSGKLTRPVRLAPRGSASSAAVAINARGEVLAAWDRALKGRKGRRAVHTRVRTAGGRLRRARRVGTALSVPKLSAALGDDGAEVVAWMSQRVGEAMPHSPAEAWVALDGDAQRLGRVPKLGTGRYVGHTGVKVAIPATGAPLVAWTGYANDRFVVRAVEVRSGAPIQTLSDPAANTVLADLATGERGQAVVLGLSGVRGTDPDGTGGVGVVAAARATGASTFGAVETIAVPEGYREAVDAEFVPGSGRVVAVWRDLGTRSLALVARDPLP